MNLHHVSGQQPWFIDVSSYYMIQEQTATYFLESTLCVSTEASLPWLQHSKDIPLKVSHHYYNILFQAEHEEGIMEAFELGQYEG